MRFAPEYVANVLNENFEDAKALLLTPLMSINYAHLVMLTEQGIITKDDARTLRAALDGISLDSIRQVLYDGTYEDLFFYIERLIKQSCDEDVAGRLHTARSRNDIDMTMYRIRQREFIAAIASAVLDLREALLVLADRHTHTVYGAHTHTQPAQPSTIAHYLLAVIEQLERDTTRLAAAFESTNRNPLGACAITGTGFPINRDRTSELLGFSGPTCNTYGSIATVDYLLESVSATSILIVGLGRVIQDFLLWCTMEFGYLRLSDGFVQGSIATVDYLLESVSATSILIVGLGRVIQDFLLWCTMEFGYLRLSDGFVQGSSIMPQKRNPVALEHARAIGSKAVGQAQAITTAVHNTPFGDIVDTEDDLQPLVASMFGDAIRMVTLVAAAMKLADFNVEHLASRASHGGTTMTELADTLVRDHDLPFRSAHAIAALLLKAYTEDPNVSLSAALHSASSAILGRPLDYTEPELQKVLSPAHFVSVRKTHGGPAPEETGRASGVSRRLLETEREAWALRREQLDRAEANLKQLVKAL